MSLWRQLARGLRVLVRRGDADQDVADEVRHYLEQRIAERIAHGASPDEARRAAQIEMGNATVAGEAVRSYGWENAVGNLIADVRHAVRQLRFQPGFATVTVLTLALGVGATTAIFSAVYPILFEPLPYVNADRLVRVLYPAADHPQLGQSFGNYKEIAARGRSFDAITVYKVWQPTITGRDEPERVDGQLVSAGFFRVLGVRPAIGRDLDAVEDRPRGATLVILSDALWRRRFGADSGIIGRRIMLDDNPFTVAGVLPKEFENVLSPSAEIWSLLQYDPALPMDGREWGHHLQSVARLKEGVSIDAARGELEAIARNPIPEFQRAPGSRMERGLILKSLRDDVTAGVKPALLAVVGAVLLVLLIACANVTNLLFGRGAQRRGEFAMRVALGAGRARLVQQTLAETVVLGLLGGVIGLLVASAGVRALVALSPQGMPRVGAIGVHAPASVFAFVASMLVGALVGLVPALHACRQDLRAGLDLGSSRTTGGHAWTRRALVVSEVALALVLLVSAGLLLRSLERLFAISPGFDPSHMLTMQVQVSSTTRFRTDDEVRRFFARALDAVRLVPGVQSAALSTSVPLSGDDAALEIYRGQVEPRADARVTDADAFRYAVTPGYFETMGIPLRRGRLLDDRDVAGAAVRPVVVSESFAARAFHGLDPIGQHIRFGGANDRPWDEIVGVVGDVKQTSLAVTEASAVYVTTAQWLWADNPLWLVIRVRRGDDPATLAPVIRRAVWSVDKDQPIVRVSTLDALVAASEAQRHFALIVFEAFALVSLALAAIGIYGVLAGGVAERTREIGVRAALGASRRDILALVVRQGMTLTALGVAVGLVGAFVASRALITLLFGVSRLDPLTLVSVVALLGAVSVAACWLPALRAARVDPSITLRDQ